MKTQLIHIMALGICLSEVHFSSVHASSSHQTEEVSTDAGHIHFPNMSHIKHNGAFHQIQNINPEDRVIGLENGSHWSIANADIIKGWGKSKNLVITQNHSGFSTSRFALMNLDLKQAEPISLVREPTPGKDVYFVKSIDRVNDIITLSDGKNWIVHSSDRGRLGKFSENDRTIIGVNTGVDKDKSP
ncbi:MAG: hypothetical protein ACRDFB_05495, partial [Rhabdochlamydiaceae bacterium]